MQYISEYIAGISIRTDYFSVKIVAIKHPWDPHETESASVLRISYQTHFIQIFNPEIKNK
jgi:hypothetical protein